MTENIIEIIWKGVQDFVAPEVRQIRQIWGPWAKVDALDSKFESKFDAMNSKFESKFDALHAEFDALRSEVRANQQGLMAALQNAVLRGDMGTQREISELRERVTRIEDQLRTLRQ